MKRSNRTLNRTLFLSVGALTLLGASKSLGLGDGPSGPSRTDAGRVRQLSNLVQSDPDERKRRNAVEELGRADPRLMSEVIQTINGALLKDSSPLVRLKAAEVLGKFKSVFASAGMTLETALESDPSEVVRSAARQALWDYHMMGYKSAKGSEGIPPQTAEPPLAKRAPLPVSMPSELPVLPVAAQVQLVSPIPLPPVVPAPPGPPVTSAPGPRVTLFSKPWLFGAKTPALTQSNWTAEPPLASPPKQVLPPAVHEPPIIPVRQGPLKMVPPPPYAVDLPPVMPPPGKN